MLVKLTDVEHETLRARAQERGTSMADVLRGALQMDPPAPEPTWEWTLGRLAVAARNGSVPAMTTLERALRPAAAESPAKPSGPRADFGLRAV
ncbi:MAG: hypothetical protein FWD12_13805 [Alphaproteobacteria bacterium]|nr:hypothetical protein [Alphaproteobacteria bacterium]